MDNQAVASTKPMDCLNDATCFVSQPRALIQAVIDANVMGEQEINAEALYGVCSLLDAASNRMCEAREVANG